MGGVALSHLPGLPLVAGVAMGIGAMSVVMLRLPLTSVLLASLLLASDGLAVMPLVIVSVVVAYVLWHGWRRARGKSGDPDSRPRTGPGRPPPSHPTQAGASGAQIAGVPRAWTATPAPVVSLRQRAGRCSRRPSSSTSNSSSSTPRVNALPLRPVQVSTGPSGSFSRACG